ncbi:MAG: hypothetical protein ACXVJT_18000, partial [Thermoanaerobaculia bacterium]
MHAAENPVTRRPGNPATRFPQHRHARRSFAICLRLRLQNRGGNPPQKRMKIRVISLVKNVCKSCGKSAENLRIRGGEACGIPVENQRRSGGNVAL